MSERLLDYPGFIKLVIEALESAGLDYMIGGAVAVWAWGEPRGTMDLDLVADIPLDRVGDLSREFEKRNMLVPADIMLNTILEDRADLPIQAIHIHTGFKADLYPMREPDELRRTALNRRQQVDLGPELGTVYLHSPEDLILYKLWFYSLNRQTKHLRDIASILRSIRDDLDMSYIDHWARRKGLNTLWGEMLARIDRGTEENKDD